MLYNSREKIFIIIQINVSNKILFLNYFRTLEYLMRHLARVAKHGASTGMTTRNVAIVWAPNLLRCEALEVGGVAALQGVGVQVSNQSSFYKMFFFQ